MTTGPLQGIRVLDLTSVIMGPYATQLLGDHGADVIAVEPPGGDYSRAMGPAVVPGLSGIALNLLRNKRSVALDLRAAGAREVVLRLAATCDAVVTNLRPAVLARLGLGYDDVSAVRPDVVYCQATGFALDDERADDPAFDDVIQAGSGVVTATLTHTGTASYAPTVLADKVCALFLANAVTSALLHRQRTGEGQFLHLSMLDVMRSFMLVEHGAGAIPEPPLGPAGYARALTTMRRPHRTLDGLLCVLPYSAANFDDLFATGGRPDLIGDERSRGRDHINHAEFLYGALRPILATRTTAEWLAFCHAHQIPAGPVVGLQDLVNELPFGEHPLAGRYRVIPGGVRYARTPTAVSRPAPTPGQHTVDILTGLGYPPDEVTALLATDEGHSAS